MSKAPQKTQDDIPTIAFVGRVNVGKSTLFNRIVEAQHALVSPIPGTTRTRNIMLAWWRGMPLRFVDTGGLTFDERVPFEKEIIKQTEIALKEADVIAFVVDLGVGILHQERELAKILRKQKKPVIVVGNKADTEKKARTADEGVWQALGFGNPIPVSALNGKNIGDLLDVLYEKVKPHLTAIEETSAQKYDEAIRVIILGKPNVGKSSLLNALLGEERVGVSPIPHTTREPHDVLTEFDGTPILFVDTAGVRRHAKMQAGLEKDGVRKSLETLKNADVALLIMDAGDFLSAQDQRLAELMGEAAAGMGLVLNKWDLVENNQNPEVRNAARRQLERHFPFAAFAPITFVSALDKKGMYTVLPLIKKVFEARAQCTFLFY